MKIRSALAIGAVLCTSGCTSVPLQTSSLEVDQKEYIGYLLHRIEVLEKRTERNEAAILGVNRRVNGLADLVSEPSPNDTFPTNKRGK